MTRDELVTVMARAIWNTSQHFMTWEEASLYFANDVADNPVEETLGEARAALDALDALGMGPKRVVELEKALRGAIGALEFSRDYHSDLGNEEQAFAQDRLDAALAALKGQSDD